MVLEIERVSRLTDHGNGSVQNGGKSVQSSQFTVQLGVKAVHNMEKSVHFKRFSVQKWKQPIDIRNTIVVRHKEKTAERFSAAFGEDWLGQSNDR